MKKIKKLLIILILCLLVFLIYKVTKKDKINYLALGDFLSVGLDSNNNTGYGYSNYLTTYLQENNLLTSSTNNFSESGLRIKDLLYDLETNRIITTPKEVLSFKKCLQEADFTTLSIGLNDIIIAITSKNISPSNLTNEEISEIGTNYIKSLEKLFIMLRKYNKKQIIMIGYYNPFPTKDITTNRLFNYLITKSKALAKKYDISYLDIYNIFATKKDYLLNPTNIHPSIEAHQVIARQIITKYLE